MAAPKHTKEVFEYLKKCANQMRTVTHSEIAENAGGFAAVGIGPILGYIRDNVCRPRGLPWLNAIAVSQDTWLPGEEPPFFMPGASEMPEEDRIRMWRGMVLQVFACDWDYVDFDEED